MQTVNKRLASILILNLGSMLRQVPTFTTSGTHQTAKFHVCNVNRQMFFRRGMVSRASERVGEIRYDPSQANSVCVIGEIKETQVKRISDTMKVWSCKISIPPVKGQNSVPTAFKVESFQNEVTEYCQDLQEGDKVNVQGRFVSQKYLFHNREAVSTKLRADKVYKIIDTTYEDIMAVDPIQRARNPSRPSSELWNDIVANPDNWMDNRSKRSNPKAPDFVHKETREGCWLSSAPPVVKASINNFFPPF